MGWWYIDDRVHVIGDEPADLIGAMFDGLVKGRAGRPSHGLQGLLDALDVVLREPSQELVRETVRGVHARMADGSRVTSRPGRGDARLVVALSRGLAEVTGAYVRRWQRKPAAVELARALSFVVRAQTERYLADVSSGQLLDVELDLEPTVTAVAPAADEDAAEDGSAERGWRSFDGGHGLFAEETLDVVLDVFDGLDGPKPSFQHILDLLAALLGQRLRADLRGGGRIVSAATAARDERLGPALADAIAKITAIFESGQGRPPTAAEIAHAFCVVLRVPDDLLSDDAAPELLALLPDT